MLDKSINWSPIQLEVRKRINYFKNNGTGKELNLNFVFAQPTCPLKKYKRKPGKEKDTFMEKETSKTCQLKVTEMCDQILHHQKEILQS
jgi:hypothetical protein